MGFRISILTRIVPFFRINKLSVEWICCCERAQKVGDYPATCRISALGFGLFDEQVEQAKQGLFVGHQLGEWLRSVSAALETGRPTESLPWPTQARRMERSTKVDVRYHADPCLQYALQCKVVSEGTAEWFAVVLRLEAPCFSSSCICATQCGKNLSIVSPGFARARHETSCPTA